MSKLIKVSIKFNSIVKQLLEDTKKITGITYLFNFNIITTFNKELPIITFYKYCTKYKDQILSRNPDYFLNSNIFKDEVNNLKDKEETDKEYYLNEFLNIKKIYNAIDDASKDNLWDILEVLVILSDKYKKLKNN
jgi:hypothetical protein